jgi:hypothetical protein
MPSACFAGREECPYCKGTDKMEVNCPKCRGTGLGKEICPQCKGRNTAFQRCTHCKGKDLTKAKCPQCRGKDLTKVKCSKCKGKAKDKNSGKDCWDCKGTGKKLPCRYCKGTGKQEKCWYCRGTGKKGKCEACSGTGKKNKCTACTGSGKTTVACKHCRMARLTAPKKKVVFHAGALREIAVAISVGKTYLVNRSNKPVEVDPFLIVGRDKDEKELFKQEMKPKDACPPGFFQAIPNPLKSFDGVKDIVLKRDDNIVPMKQYEKTSDKLEEFLKKGKLTE